MYLILLATVHLKLIFASTSSVIPSFVEEELCTVSITAFPLDDSTGAIPRIEREKSFTSH